MLLGILFTGFDCGPLSSQRHLIGGIRNVLLGGGVAPQLPGDRIVLIQPKLDIALDFKSVSAVYDSIHHSTSVRRLTIEINFHCANTLSK
ncbi:hypothetical protein ADIMK_2620 [Marinobacterium lacunae]|uniref:Uncharacterized protein n=1 Tax=Marinobacterium lacunae TaxID=1232683 RepID=A0A081FX41_9GAMM|nr:hypothetical protein [Marinobacterium lacunae]KEA63096.1 hypothetical protein ADIMK_2620 [Marinobacterium lacunae]